MRAAYEPFADMLRTTALLAVYCAAVVCHGTTHENAEPRTSAEPPLALPLGPPTARRPAAVGRHGLGAHVRRVADREFTVFTHRRLSITLDRPRPDDPRIVLAVAGTYTDKDGSAMGFFAIDGEIERTAKMPWEAVLRVERGVPRILRATPDAFDLAGAPSILQGHLLVDQGEVRPLQPSRALHRRALVTTTAGAFQIIDGRDPQPLAEFAEDLVALGAVEALNLDMGAWSGGFYRDPGVGDLRPLGHDITATHRQSNWLVLEALDDVTEAARSDAP